MLKRFDYGTFQQDLFVFMRRRRLLAIASLAILILQISGTDFNSEQSNDLPPLPVTPLEHEVCIEGEECLVKPPNATNEDKETTGGEPIKSLDGMNQSVEENGAAGLNKTNKGEKERGAGKGPQDEAATPPSDVDPEVDAARVLAEAAKVAAEAAETAALAAQRYEELRRLREIQEEERLKKEKEEQERQSMHKDRQPPDTSLAAAPPSVTNVAGVPVIVDPSEQTTVSQEEFLALKKTVEELQERLFEKDELEDEGKSLLEVFGERARKWIVTKATPPTDKECSFSYKRGRCEPKCQCRMQYRFGDYTAGRMCRLVPAWEKDPACPTREDPTDEPVFVRGRRALQTWFRNSVTFYREKVAHPTDEICSFNVKKLRCVPEDECHYRYELGDLHPSRSCRLREGFAEV